MEANIEVLRKVKFGLHRVLEARRQHFSDLDVARIEQAIDTLAALSAQGEAQAGGDEVLVAITRGEGYEDVAPELVAEDALGLKNPFHWRVVITPGAVPEGVETLRRCLHWAVGDDAEGWESGDGWPLGRFLVPALAGDIETAARELAAHEAEYNAAQAEAEAELAAAPGPKGWAND